MMRSTERTSCRHRIHARAFSLAELLVVIGVLALLAAITIPSIQLAQRQARQTHCAANLQQQGVALENLKTSYEGFYPLWDDSGTPIRYTWIDILVQTQAASSHRFGYCPDDSRPDSMNMARARHFGSMYPGGALSPGVDYSYGIGVPLSAGGWRWQPGFSPPEDDRRRVFEYHDENPAQRVLAADSYWTFIYNLSGSSLTSGIWNDPTQFDNTVAYRRHPGLTSNILLQDGHVETLTYRVENEEEPVDTMQHFVWHPGEPLHVGPEHSWGENYYPNVPPVSSGSPMASYAGDFPFELNPSYYTVNQLWTHIRHK